MGPRAAAPREFRDDAFISYSRKDREFSGRLEQALGSWADEVPEDSPPLYTGS